MAKFQSHPHKKITIHSDLKRQASTVARQAVLRPRDPRTVCMTKDELGLLQASFRLNRWPERAEKERLAQLIGKSYEKVHHWFSNQRQKMANVEKAIEPPTTQHTGAAGPTKVKRETLPRAPTPDPFMREDSSDASDIPIEHAHIFLEFVASVRAAYRTPSP